MKVCYPGSFDPITNGHLDIIERAARMFDEVIVLIMRNPRKNCTFSEEQRVAMIQKVIDAHGLTNVSVKVGKGLTVNYAASLGCQGILRGIRAISDYEFELQQATANLSLNQNVETLLLIARPEYSFLSSSMVKEIAMNGGDVSGLLPDVLVAEITEGMKTL